MGIGIMRIGNWDHGIWELGFGQICGGAKGRSVGQCRWLVLYVVLDLDGMLQKKCSSAAKCNLQNVFLQTYL